MSDVNLVLEARNITKNFGAFTALEDVSFDLQEGEIHALLGENGAGKSTLMNVLSGLLRPDKGEIFLDNKPVQFRSPAEAARQGIGMVHQHFLLVPPLSVAENLLLGAPMDNSLKGGLFSYPLASVLAEAKELADKLEWQIPWNEPAGNLPVGTQQRIEILKALRGKTKILIFDEPTAVLTPTETPELFATMRRLASEGCGIVFISHKLDEVMSLAGRVTVLRRGKVVERTRTKDTDTRGLAVAMVGEMVSEIAAEKVGKVGAAFAASKPEMPKLSVRDLTVNSLEKGAQALLSAISFTVAPGEILGIAGVDGNGQEPLAECLSGLLEPTSGEIRVSDKVLSASPNAFRVARVGVIPADRQRRGLALPMTITENLTLGVQDQAEFTNGPFHLLLNGKALYKRAVEKIAAFDIRATGPEATVQSLSGGNQQKVVIARALSGNPEVVIAVNPTRGLDVGAISYVHSALRKAQSEGAAIVLISTELDEVLTLSDRVGVLFSGKLMGIVSPDTPREEIGRMMGGSQK